MRGSAPAHYATALAGIDLGAVVVALVILLLSLTVHETAHAWTADRLGDPTARLLGRVSLNPLVHVDPIGTFLFPLMAALSGVPLIGWAKPVPVNVARLPRHRRDFMLVAAAGPMSNLGLAVVASVLWQAWPESGGAATGALAGVPVGLLLQRAVEINVLLAVFNLIPIPPLDGGNVLAGLLPSSLAGAVDFVRPYGFLLLYVLMFTGTLGTLIGPPYLFLLSWLR